MLIFHLDFVLELYLSGILYGFSVDYNSINKSSLLNIHKYLMIKILHKMFGIIKKNLLCYYLA